MSDEQDARLAERKFMHDLATPLAIALGYLEGMLDQDKLTPSFDDVHRTRLEKMKKALDKLQVMLAERRTILIDAAEKTKTG